LKAVLLLLQRHFSSYVAKAETRQILLHEDNQSVVLVNVMVAPSRPKVAEPRRLEAMLRVLGMRGKLGGCRAQPIATRTLWCASGT
jgi:hypothetical protein